MKVTNEIENAELVNHESILVLSVEGCPRLVRLIFRDCEVEVDGKYLIAAIQNSLNIPEI